MAARNIALIENDDEPDDEWWRMEPTADDLSGWLFYEQRWTTVLAMARRMAACFAGGGRIEIRVFGSFSLRLRPARVAGNPRIGTPVALPARYAACVKPGKKLRERVNREYRGPSETC